MIEQTIRLLSGPEGNLIYSIAVGFSALAAWIASIYAGGSGASRTARRMQRGLFLIFIAQLVLFLVAWLAWSGKIDGHMFLPPLDRTLALFSLVVAIWLWAIPDPLPEADLVAAIVAAVAILFGIGSMVVWLRFSTNVYYDASVLGGYAYYAGLALLIVGMLIIVVRRPSYWYFGALMIVVLLAGYVAEYFKGQLTSDYSWYIHLGEMAGYLVLLALPLRLAELRRSSTAQEKAMTPSTDTFQTGTGLIDAITSLLTETSPQQSYQEVTKAAALLMHAEYSLLMLPPKTAEQIIIPVGYDRLLNRKIEGFTADGRVIPTMLEALRNGQMLYFTSNNGPEVQVFANLEGLKSPLHVLMVPFHPKNTSLVMEMVVLSGASSKAWSQEDAVSLEDIVDRLVGQAGEYSKGTTTPADLAELEQKLESAQAIADQVRIEYAQLKAKYDNVSISTGPAAPLAAEMAILAENQRNLQETISQLENRNRELETMVTKGRPSIDEVEQLRQELRSALADLARIPSTLSKSDQRMLELQLSTVKRLDDMQPTELVNSIAQEFRQPLASIIGYTDLLLGESVGLLGAVQQRFVERVKASAQRMGILLNELVQVMSIDGGRVDQTVVSVDLKSVVDEAIGNVAAQIREKNIDLRVELPDNPPQVKVNQDALLQILENLLQNACLVTPSDGWIRLLANVEDRENVPSYMHISVTDQGGGVEKNDISRVFMRRFKMANPMIQGIGDTGVGLSIVKSLVELNKGRVWVDSREGSGATFSVLLPLAERQPDQESQAVPAE